MPRAKTAGALAVGRRSRPPSREGRAPRTAGSRSYVSVWLTPKRSAPTPRSARARSACRAVIWAVRSWSSDGRRSRAPRLVERRDALARRAHEARDGPHVLVPVHEIVGFGDVRVRVSLG